MSPSHAGKSLSATTAKLDHGLLLGDVGAPPEPADPPPEQELNITKAIIIKHTFIYPPMFATGELKSKLQ